MNDDTTFHDVPHARSGDVSTSQDAAAQTKITNDCLRMLRAFAKMKGVRDLTAEEAGRVAGMLDGHQRCSDLHRHKLIERTTEKGITTLGGKAYRCRITQAGMQFILGAQQP